MPHVSLPEGLSGITGGCAYRPETAKPIRELAEVLLRRPSSLKSGEREIIATFVSSRNDCYFCQNSHRAAAFHYLNGDYHLVDTVRDDYRSALVSSKLKALLTIAAKVQNTRIDVSSDDVAAAWQEGAIYLEIHDAVLIAAAFFMSDRYVDGLGAG